MTFRRSLAALLAAGLVLTGVACSGGDDDDGTTTTAADTPETTESTDSTTTTTVSDDEYAATIAEAKTNVEAAGTDFCAVSTAAGNPAQPANPAQVEEYIGLFVATYEAAASALDAEDPTSATALRNAATALSQEAEAAGYSLDFLNSDTQSEALSSEEFMAASEALQAKYAADCAHEELPEGSTTVPEQPEG